MPTYSFKNKETGEEWEEFMSISASEELVENSKGNIYKLPTAMAIIGGTGDAVKPKGDFKEVLSRIADQNPYAPIANEYGKKDPTSVKLRNVVDNVRKKVGPAIDS